jgi:hypothetical protein
MTEAADFVALCDRVIAECREARAEIRALTQHIARSTLIASMSADEREALARLQAQQLARGLLRPLRDGVVAAELTSWQMREITLVFPASSTTSLTLSWSQEGKRHDPHLLPATSAKASNRCRRHRTKFHRAWRCDRYDRGSSCPSAIDRPPRKHPC